MAPSLERLRWRLSHPPRNLAYGRRGPVLHLHRSERADYLVAALGDLLLNPLDDPMAQEVVAVPTHGVERWLTQRLSHRLGAQPNRADGICANVDFPFPGLLVGGATAVACGFDPDTDPWRPERSVWPLLELVDACADEPFLDPLTAHLRASSPGGSEGGPTLRRFSTLRHLSDLYDRYAVHRPDMILAWIEGAGDGNSVDHTSPDPHRGWQAELWRRLRERIGVPSPGRALRGRLRPAGSRAGPAGAAGAHIGVWADPAAVELPESPGSHQRRSRRPPLPASSLRRPVGEGASGRAPSASKPSS